MKKPHKGTIQNWYKFYLTEEVKQSCRDNYGEEPGLGYIILGTAIQHPQFGTTSGFSSSWVVKHKGNAVETRNSRYTLGKPRQ